MEANTSSNFSAALLAANNNTYTDTNNWTSLAPTFAPINATEVWNDESELYLTVPLAAAIASKVTASFSLIGSYVILREIYNDKQKQRSNSNVVIHNLLISLSMADVLSSVCTLLGTLMTPAELSDYVWGAMGTVVTCELQGFLVVLGYMASPLFNCALAATYMCLIRYGKRDPQLQPYQKWVHSSLWGFSLFLAIVPLPNDWYNNGGDICWSAASPFYCPYEDEVYCQRGDIYATIYGAALFVVIPFVSFLFCGVVLCLIWRAVRNMEDRARVYNSGWSTEDDESVESNDDDDESSAPSPSRAATDRTKSREMMKQGVFFILAFFVTYFPASISWVFEESEAFGILLFLSYSVLLPLQGFWNCLVFIRQREMKTWEGRIFRLSFFYWREDSTEARRRSSPTPVR